MELEVKTYRRKPLPVYQETREGVMLPDSIEGLRAVKTWIEERSEYQDVPFLNRDGILLRYDRPGDESYYDWLYVGEVVWDEGGSVGYDSGMEAVDE